MTDDTTTIEIREDQKRQLDEIGGNEAYKHTLQELIENHRGSSSGELLTDAQRGEVREIALDVVNDRVVRDALE